MIPLLSIIYAALTAARLAPQVPYLAWAVLFTVSLTLVNIPGIRVTTRASSVMMIIMTACAVLFVALAARYVAGAHGLAGLFDLRGVWRPESFGMRPMMLGASIAALSYIGFDAISTLAEDTVNPERDIAFSTVFVCVLQTVFCVVTVYLAALVWPDYRTYPEAETVILDISRQGGRQLDVWIYHLRVARGRLGQRAHRPGWRFTPAVRHGARRSHLPPSVRIHPSTLFHAHPEYLLHGRTLTDRGNVPSASRWPWNC